MKNIFNRIFCRWTKWELYESDLPYKRTETNLLTGLESNTTNVIIDIYEKTNKYNGLKKYKKIVKL